LQQINKKHVNPSRQIQQEGSGFYIRSNKGCTHAV